MGPQGYPAAFAWNGQQGYLYAAGGFEPHIISIWDLQREICLQQVQNVLQSWFCLVTS